MQNNPGFFWLGVWVGVDALKAGLRILYLESLSYCIFIGSSPYLVSVSLLIERILTFLRVLYYLFSSMHPLSVLLQRLYTQCVSNISFCFILFLCITMVYSSFL